MRNSIFKSVVFTLLFSLLILKVNIFLNYDPFYRPGKEFILRNVLVLPILILFGFIIFNAKEFFKSKFNLIFFTFFWALILWLIFFLPFIIDYVNRKGFITFIEKRINLYVYIDFLMTIATVIITTLLIHNYNYPKIKKDNDIIDDIK